MVIEIPPPKMHASGTTFVKYAADGGSFAYYMSGRMACAYERMAGGFYCYFLSDTPKQRTLCTFDPAGCGYCSFADGQPRLTSQKTGGTYSDSSGQTIRLWTALKPLRQGDPITFELSQHISIEFQSRQQIKAKLTVAGLTEEYDLGEVQKSTTDSYLSNAVSQIKMGPERGKYVLDIDACRRHAEEAKERKAAMGAPADVALPSVNVTEATMQKLPQLRPIVAATSELQHAVERGDYHVDVFVSTEAMRATLAEQMPTLTLGDSIKTDPYSRTFASLPSSNPDVLDKLLKESATDGGALPLSKSIKDASGRYRPEHGQHYKTARKRLLELKSRTYDENLKDIPKGTLSVVVCLAGWMPACRRQEPVLEALNGKLAKAAGAPPPSTLSGGAQKESYPNFVLRKFDMSESRFLRDRHNIATLPMYLMYFDGRLAYASSTLNGFGTSEDDLVAQARKTLMEAQAGKFMPENFKFGTTSDSMTDKFADTLNATAPGLGKR